MKRYQTKLVLLVLLFLITSFNCIPSFAQSKPQTKPQVHFFEDKLEESMENVLPRKFMKKGAHSHYEVEFAIEN